MKTLHNILFALACILIITSANAQYPNQPLAKNTQDQSEPAIAVSPLNNSILLAVWNDFRATTYSKPGYAFSTNGGGSWTNDTVFNPMPGGFSYGVDPSCSFDRRGNAFFCYFLTNSISVPGQVWISRTKAFQAQAPWHHDIVSVLNTGQDKPFMTIDNTGGSNDGRIYVSWTDFSAGSKIKCSFSSDTGNNFPRGCIRVSGI